MLSLSPSLACQVLSIYHLFGDPDLLMYSARAFLHPKRRIERNKHNCCFKNTLYICAMVGLWHSVRKLKRRVSLQPIVLNNDVSTERLQVGPSTGVPRARSRGHPSRRSQRRHTSRVGVRPLMMRWCMNQFGTRTEPFGGPTYSPTTQACSAQPSGSIHCTRSLPPASVLAASTVADPPPSPWEQMAYNLFSAS